MAGTKVVKGVKTGKDSAGVLLFKKHFKIRMAAVDALDTNDIEARGMFTTGYADIDMQAAKRPTEVWRTVAEMVELWYDGVSFDLVYGMTDAEKINNLIQEHIGDCVWYHENSLKTLRREDPSITQQRLEDLKAFDEFGKQIYNRVRLYGKGAELEGVEKLLQKDAPVIGRDVFGQEKLTTRRTNRDYVTVEERIDYSALKKRSKYRR